MANRSGKFFERLTALTATLALASLVTPATVMQAQAFTGGNFPSCTQSNVLSYIQKRFVWTDTHLLKRDLRIAEIRNPHRNWKKDTDATHRIARTYCHATAVMSDGKKRQMWYRIDTGMGFAGMGDNVDFCISGLDPWHIYGAWCRSVR